MPVAPTKHTPDIALMDALRGLPPLTDKQFACLRFVAEYFMAQRYYPTQREVAEAMHLRSSTASTFLTPLVNKGFLTREPRRRRNIMLTPAGIKKLGLMGIDVRGKLLAADES
jgi:DNA-binding MarR family transcriptional regulator